MPRFSHHGGKPSAVCPGPLCPDIYARSPMGALGA
jgi:hypothetical protein